MITIEKKLIVVTIDAGYDPVDTYLNTVNQLIDVIPHSDPEANYLLCQLLKSMMPDIDQARKMFDGD